MLTAQSLLRSKRMVRDSTVHLVAKDGGAQFFTCLPSSCVASISLKARSNLSVKDREKSLAMSLVAERDLRDELPLWNRSAVPTLYFLT